MSGARRTTTALTPPPPPRELPPAGRPARRPGPAAARRPTPADGRPAAVPRSLAAYLAVPRPHDMIKGLLLPCTFALAVLAGADVTGRTLLRALVVWAALELLIYPARYQWNDVRGFVADQQHPAAAGRGRLPGPLERARARVSASCAIALARLAVTALLVLLLPALHLGPALAALTAGVFGVAIVYELLRAACTGHSAQVPPPASAGVVAVWIVVGAGYVVRGMGGLALAVNLGGRPALAVAAGLALWAFGIAFVTSRWALEATAFGRPDSRGTVVWTARPEQAREHLLALVRWLPPRADTPVLADWAPLRRRTSLKAPWNQALLVAGAAATVTGWLLTGPASWARLVLAAALGAVTAAAAVRLPRRAAVVAAGSAAQLTALLLLSVPRPLAALLPWLSVLAAHTVFSSHSLNTTGSLTGRLRRLAATACAPAARAVLGTATYDAVRRHHHEP